MGYGQSAVKLVGDKELIRNLNMLQDASVKKIMRPAIAKGIRPIVKEAKRRVPIRFGYLKQALRSFVGKGKTAWAKAFVSPKIVGMYMDKKIRPSKYAWVVEFGHGGPHPAPAEPFLRPALEGKKNEAKTIIEKEAKENLHKIVKAGTYKVKV